MKIAIMTWFSYVNYGTALQAFALSKYLTQKGYKVKVIRYYPKIKLRFDSKYKEFKFRIKQKLRTMLTSKNIISEYSGEVFKKFIEEYIPLTEEFKTDLELDRLNDEFDVFICGSDQIWQPLNLDTHYYLDFVRDNSNKIAYAPSMGITKIYKSEDEKIISDLIRRFKYLSVREQSLAKMIKKLNGKQAETVLDPTLLLDKDDWGCLDVNINIKKPYLLAYFLGNNEKYWKVVKKIASILNLNICIVPIFKKDIYRQSKISSDKSAQLVKNISPAVFVSLIRQASFLCTDSFHGVAFSVNFNKQFIAFKRFKDDEDISQNSRVLDFLSIFGLESRLYNPSMNINEKIEFENVNVKLNCLRNKSEEFLLDSLEKISDQI